MIYTPNQAYDAITSVFDSPIKVLDSYAGVNQMTLEEAEYAYHNLQYAYTNCPAFYRQVALESYNGVTPTATEMLVSKPVMETGTTNVIGSTAEKMPAVTTGAGNVKSGALAGRMPIGTAIAGIGIGAGIGIKEVAQHPKFWNDLSDAVFNDIYNADVVDPGALITQDGKFSETLQVLWRCLEDGSIQAYCDKRDADKILHHLYETNCLTPTDVINDIDHAGVQDVPIAEMSLEYGAKALQLKNLFMSAEAINAGYTAGRARYPDANVVVCTASSSSSGSLLVFTWYNMNPVNVPVTTMSYYGETVYGAPNVQRYGGSQVLYNTDTGTYQYAVVDNPGRDTIPLGVNNTSATNAGSILHQQNEAVYFNDPALYPPIDPSLFWSVFANWLANGFTVNPYNPVTNAYEPVTYIPITAPETNWKLHPIDGDQESAWTGIYQFVEPFTDPTTNPVNNPSPWIYQSIGSWQLPNMKVPDTTPWDNNPLFPQPTPTPIGSTPLIGAPTSGVSSGSKLYTVYNPTQAEIDSLGGYLWTQNIVELISQFFKNNPLEAIISLHMIYCTPSTGSPKNIILGYLDSGVSANIVTSQYKDVPCGYVDIPEIYNNALDYTGVSVQIFLPFVGFRTLKTKDVMGKRLEVDYKVDVYTGVCLAMLYVVSASTRQLLYSFEGNCSVQIPLTASDRTRLLAGITTAGVSAFTGNPAGVVGGIASIGTNIDRSGSFTGNAGAMGVKKPYIIITRAINAQASHYNKMYGYPINKYGKLMNFRGFTRCQSVHVEIPDATHDELFELETQLTTGIII